MPTSHAVSRGALLVALLTIWALPASADTLVQRGPHTAPGTVETLLGSGLQSLNLEGAPFESDKGVSIVSKAQADDGTGVIRVYSAVDSRDVPGIPDALIGSALGQVLANGTVVGPVGGGSVDVGFVFDFDGAFHTYGGNVFHQLGATLSVALPTTVLPFTNIEHVASLTFSTDLLDAEAINVAGKTEKRYFTPSFEYVTEQFDGASFTVNDLNMDLVAGSVRLDMSLEVGQSFILVANLMAWTSPEPLIPTSGPLNYGESWGAVDGFNTGSLRIELPEGYALSGREGLLISTVVTTPIPEPGTWALFAAGLLLLPLLARRRRR
jgi:hypothetical protein